MISSSDKKAMMDAMKDMKGSGLIEDGDELERLNQNHKKKFKDEANGLPGKYEHHLTEDLVKEARKEKSAELSSYFAQMPGYAKMYISGKMTLLDFADNVMKANLAFRKLPQGKGRKGNEFYLLMGALEVCMALLDSELVNGNIDEKHMVFVSRVESRLNGQT